MPNQTIELLGIVPGTDDLILSDDGDTEVRTNWINRKITWEIDDLRIKSFLIKGKTTYNPFEGPIPIDFDTRLRLKVKKPQSPRDWEYSIHWKDEHGAVHIYDPKISIDPAKIVSIGYLVLGLGAFCLSVVGISWLLSRKKSGK